jgi:hypothetical protein
MKTLEIAEEKPKKFVGMWINHGAVYGWNVEGSFAFTTSVTSEDASSNQKDNETTAKGSAALTYEYDNDKIKASAELEIEYAHKKVESKAVSRAISETNGNS